jgi:hypothetical protein
MANKDHRALIKAETYASTETTRVWLWLWHKQKTVQKMLYYLDLEIILWSHGPESSIPRL